MRSMKLLGIAVGAVCALSAVLVTPALAKNNPVFLSGGGIFMGPVEILAETNGTQLLQSKAAETIACSSVKLNSGATISNDLSPNWGLDSETIVYEGCKYGKSTTCTVKNKGGTIETDPLVSKLAWEKETGAEKETTTGTLTVFTPTGTNFVELEFSGTGCPILTKDDVKGSVAVSNAGNSATEELSHELSAPEPAIAKYFYNVGSKTETGKAALEAFGVEAKYVGKDKIMLTSDANWSVS
jgi:hypothetical protein